MFKLPSLIEMLQAGMHFGHSANRWHPKMKPFIFGQKSGIHLINLEVSQKHLEDALSYAKDAVSKGAVVLFVGTKIQAKGIVKKYADSCGMPSVTERWLGGTLTNFSQMKETLKRLKGLRDQKEKGELKRYTKKEQLLISRDMDEMEKKMGGILSMTKIPEILFVVDVRHEKTAVKEAKVTRSKVIGMCDTNVNPEHVDFVIPSNDDAVKSIELVCKLLCEAIKEGKSQSAKMVVEKIETSTQTA